MGRKPFATPEEEKTRRSNIVNSDSYRQLLDFKQKHKPPRGLTMRTFIDKTSTLERDLAEGRLAIRVSWIERVLGGGDTIHEELNNISKMARGIRHVSDFINRVEDNKNDPFFVNRDDGLMDHMITGYKMQTIAHMSQYDVTDALISARSLQYILEPEQFQRDSRGRRTKNPRDPEEIKEVGERLKSTLDDIIQYFTLFEVCQKEHAKAFGELRKEGIWISKSENAKKWWEIKMEDQKPRGR